MKGCGGATLVHLQVAKGLGGGGGQPIFASREGLGGGGGGQPLVHLQVVKGWGGGGNPCPFASREGLWGRQPLSICKSSRVGGGGLNLCPFASREGFGGVSPVVGFGVINTLASSSAMIAWRPFRNVLVGFAALAEPA